jgi:sec-independent protein translocase protein TatA
VDFLDIGPLELILAFVVFLIVFGPQKIPEIGTKLGKLFRQAQKASRDFMGSLEDEKKDGR